MEKQRGVTIVNKNAHHKLGYYTVLYTGRVITLILKKKCFDMIASGERKEDYREIKPYWAKRLEDNPLAMFTTNFRKFDNIKFKKGYRKDAPMMIVECLGIDFDYLKPKWCDGVEDFFYVIRLGKILFNNAIM